MVAEFDCHRCSNSSQTCWSVLQEFVEGPFSQNNLDPGASMIIPVPGPTGGVIVVGESVIMYVRKKRSSDDQAVKSIQVNATIVKVSLAGQTVTATAATAATAAFNQYSFCCSTQSSIVMPGRT